MLDVNQDGAATPQDAIVILRHLSLVSGPALTAGVITGGAQTDPAVIKTYLNFYTPGASVSSASEELSAVSAQLSASPSGNSALSTEPTASGSGLAASGPDSPLPLAAHLSPDSASAAVAATQLARQAVQTSPWVSQFVGSGAMDEEQDLVVML
jgi:hypothetical protein